MWDAAQRSLPEEVMNREEMMIMEEIKRKSRLIYGITLLTPHKIRDASQSKSVLYLHA